MKPLPLLIIGLALISGPLFGESFEGKVTMAIKTSDSDNGSPVVNYSIKEGFMRMDATAGGHQSSVIFDSKNKQMIILIPERSMYMVRSLAGQGSTPSYGGQGYPGAAAPQGNPGKLEATGETEKILGYTCTKYVVTSSGGDSTQIWVTDQLGMFGGFNLGGGPGGRSPVPQGWASALQGKSFFPMRVIGTENGKTFRMDVTAVSKESVPDSEFAPPDGWQKFDMGNFMQGMGAGGFAPPSNN